MEFLPHYLGPLSAFGASVTWAVGSAGYARLSLKHSAFAVNFARALVALPLFLICVFAVGSGWSGGLEQLGQVRSHHVGWFALSIFASYGLGDVLFMWSAQSIGVPAALAIASTYPILTAGVGSVVQGEQLAATQVLGLLITVGGVITVILSGKNPMPAGSGERQGKLGRKAGIALAFGTALFWALNSYASARSGQDLSPLVGNCIRMSFALVMTATFGKILFPQAPILLPASVFKGSLALFVFEAFGGSLCFIYGLTHSPLAVGSTLASLAPVLSVPVALCFGLEKFSIYRTLGVCAVVGGLWLLLGVI